MSRPDTHSWLNALTDAIVRGQIDVETARSLVIQASSAQPISEEMQQVIDLNPTVGAAARAMGVSRATLYRRMAKSKAAGAGGL
jgi:transcriptional regulator of acetoin/glycerol metabolism